MKKRSLMILLTMVMMLTGCRHQEGGTGMLKSGTYILNNDAMNPYIFFDTQQKIWRIGPGLMYSVGIGGTYDVSGNRIIARDQKGEKTIMELSVSNENEIRVETISPEMDQNWITAGEVFVYDQFDNGSPDIDSIFRTVCSADGALTVCLDQNITVIDNLRCVSGQQAWEEFRQQVSEGLSARTLVAHYYTLDKEHVSEELYQQEKDNYPQLYYYLVEYDNNQFTVTIRKSNEEQQDYHGVFRCLNHYAGDNPESALYRHYDRYVLTDDPEVTWQQLEWSILSSDINTLHYDFLTLFEDMHD